MSDETNKSAGDNGGGSNPPAPSAQANNPAKAPRPVAPLDAQALGAAIAAGIAQANQIAKAPAMPTPGLDEGDPTVGAMFIYEDRVVDSWSQPVDPDLIPAPVKRQVREQKALAARAQIGARAGESF